MLFAFKQLCKNLPPRHAPFILSYVRERMKGQPWAG
uniref:Uncharacterized protein n=1 Tax=Siphoviridae sp. ctMOb8 TaxID=2825460 RepID=A0A8S5Q0F5_9CAUD|nr:MAG TPA: hypothetical protein [Siphoviridae sp. ctMOb8]